MTRQMQERETDKREIDKSGRQTGVGDRHERETYNRGRQTREMLQLTRKWHIDKTG